MAGRGWIGETLALAALGLGMLAVGGCAGPRPAAGWNMRQLERPQLARRMVYIQERCRYGCDSLRMACRFLQQAAELECPYDLSSCDRGCDSRPALRAAARALPPPGWGLSAERPIRVCGPGGLQQFLADLRCGDGRPVRKKELPAAAGAEAAAERLPIVGMLPAERWQVRCTQQTVRLHFDPNHCGAPRPWAAPDGLRRPLRAAQRPRLPPGLPGADRASLGVRGTADRLDAGGGSGEDSASTAWKLTGGAAWSACRRRADGRQERGADRDLDPGAVDR